MQLFIRSNVTIAKEGMVWRMFHLMCCLFTGPSILEHDNDSDDEGIPVCSLRYVACVCVCASESDPVLVLKCTLCQYFSLY